MIVSPIPPPFPSTALLVISLLDVELFPILHGIMGPIFLSLSPLIVSPSLPPKNSHDRLSSPSLDEPQYLKNKKNKPNIFFVIENLKK